MTNEQIADWELRRAQPDGECLITAACLTAAGYGVVRIAGSTVYLHRMILEQRLGRPLDPDKQTCHRCDRRACINPEHLYEGTFQDNSDDKVRAGRQRKGERHGNAKLLSDEVQAIRTRRERGRSVRSLAREYGVSESTIHNIVQGRAWQHVKQPA